MNDFIVFAILFCLGCACGFQLGNNYSSKNNLGIPAEYQSSSFDIPCLEKLNALKEFIETIDLPKESKIPILNKVQCEYDYIERKTMIELGRETYKKSKEKKAE